MAQKLPPTNLSENEIQKKILKKVTESQKSTKVVEKFLDKLIIEITK